jgi:4-aminobutyrate aminotransferase-like enzyme
MTTGGTKELLVGPTRKPAGPTAKDRVVARLWERGVYVMPGQGSVIVLAPPLTVTCDELAEHLVILDEALELADAETR